MGSKGIGSDDEKKKIASIVSDAVMQVSEEKNGKFKVDLDLIKIEKKAGGEVLDTSLIRGVLVNKEIVHSGMPKSVKAARAPSSRHRIGNRGRNRDRRENRDIGPQDGGVPPAGGEDDEDMVEKIAATSRAISFSSRRASTTCVPHFLSKKGITA